MKCRVCGQPQKQFVASFSLFELQMQQIILRYFRRSASLWLRQSEINCFIHQDEEIVNDKIKINMLWTNHQPNVSK